MPGYLGVKLFHFACVEFINKEFANVLNVEAGTIFRVVILKGCSTTCTYCNHCVIILKDFFVFINKSLYCIHLSGSKKW